MDEGRDLGVDSSNNIYLAGRFTDTLYTLHMDFMVSKIDSSGNIIWMNKASGARCHAISVDKAGNVYFTGTLNGNMILNNDTLTSQSTSSLIGKFDSNGNTVWIASNYGIQWSSPTDISVTPQGNSFISGSFYTSVPFGPDLLLGNEHKCNYFTTMLNDTSIIPTHNNLINGNIYNDLNSNCIKEAGEDSITGFSVMAQPGNYFAVSDINGNYSLKVDSGAYIVTQLLPVSHSVISSQICPALIGSYSVNAFSSNTIYSGNDFADNINKCPVFDISMDSQNDILCNVIVQTGITIYNYGLVPAVNSQLTVIFSSAFIPVSSSPTWLSYIPGDTTLIFNLGTIPPNSFLNVTINDSVSCSSPNYMWIPYIHIVRITPINSCIPSDSLLCSDTLDQHYFMPIGFNNIINESGFKIFPNPAHDKLIVTSSAQLKQTLVTIFNMQGQQRLSAQFENQNTMQLDVSTLSKGIYIVKVKSGNGVVNKKLIIQ